MNKGDLKKKSIWNQIIKLGESLQEDSNLGIQSGLILSVMKELFQGENKLWLAESIFHLPGKRVKGRIEYDNQTNEMQEAINSRGLIKKTGSINLLSIPILNQNNLLGALQVSRLTDRPFSKEEEETFLLLANQVELTLGYFQRRMIEHWRIEQLNLVKIVGEQIVKVKDFNELVVHLTVLIQETFQYYYVALFTLDNEGRQLKFRSSAGPLGKKKRGLFPLVLEVELGQGLIGLAALTGEEMISNDINTEPRFKYIESLPETLSEVVLPLAIEGKILGVLDIQSNEANAFHPNDLLVLRTLAANISIAIESARLYGELQKRANHLSLVTEISRDITTILELDELLNRVSNLIRERLGYPHVHLYSVHPNRRRIIHEAGSGTRTTGLEDYSLDMDIETGLIPWVVKNGRSLVINDISREPLYTSSPTPPFNTLAEMVIPLSFDGKIIGVMDIQSDQMNAFSDDDRFICEAMADNIAAAMHNADVYRSEKWRRQVADGLREVAGLLSADASLDDVLDSVLKELEKTLDCAVSAIWLLDGDELYLAHIRGADPIDVEITRKNWPDSTLFLINALDSEFPVIRKPIDPMGPTGATMGYAADYSSIAVRLQVGNNALGILTLSHPLGGKYGHEASEITSTFAGYAAVAIENARLYDAAQEQAYASAALLQVAQTVANANNLDELLGSIARITPILVGVESCAIYLYQGGVFVTSHVYGSNEDYQKSIESRFFTPGEYPLLDEVLNCRQMVVGSMNSQESEKWLCPDLALSKEDSFYAMEMGENLILGYPLVIKNEFFGVMVIEETAEARRFRQKRIEIIHGISQQVALSIQNELLQEETVARERLEYEFHLARQIQQTFLPETLPDFENWDLAAFWQPARQVGGDFYDVFELPNGKLGIIIADVSDKGIPAALFMAVTRTLVRAIILEKDSPEEVLRLVNNVIIPENQQGMFVTIFFAFLSLKTGELKYVNAGHNPPLLVNKKNNIIRSLNRTGIALGIVDELELKEETIILKIGDTLFLYTDGVTEAVSPDDEFFGEIKLKEVLLGNKDSPAKEIINGIEESVFNFIGSRTLMDDLTMLVLQKQK